MRGGAVRLTYHPIPLTVQTGTVSWALGPNAHFDIARLSIFLSAAPTVTEYITISLDSHLGSAYDHVLRVINPKGCTSVVEENIDGLHQGDKLLVEFANSEANTIYGLAMFRM